MLYNLGIIFPNLIKKDIKSLPIHDEFFDDQMQD